jgi:hypothetical protein
MQVNQYVSGTPPRWTATNAGSSTYYRRTCKLGSRRKHKIIPYFVSPLNAAVNKNGQLALQITIKSQYIRHCIGRRHLRSRI